MARPYDSTTIRASIRHSCVAQRVVLTLLDLQWSWQRVFVFFAIDITTASLNFVSLQRSADGVHMYNTFAFYVKEVVFNCRLRNREV